MFHAFDVVTNTKGDSLVGYQVLVRDPTTGAVIPIFADDNGTPIGTVSNLINIALTDNAGNYSFFVPFGTYNLEFRTPDGVSVRTINSVPFNSGSQGAPGRDGLDGNTGPANSTYTSLASLKAAPVTNASYIFAPPGGTEGSTTAGTFLYQTAGAPYTADGVNIIKLDAVPLTTGALVRQGAQSVLFQNPAAGALPRSLFAKAVEPPLSPFEFMSQAQQDDVRSGAASIDVTAPFNACFAAATSANRSVELPDGRARVGNLLFGDQNTAGQATSPTGLVGGSKTGFTFVAKPGLTGRLLQCWSLAGVTIRDFNIDTTGTPAMAWDAEWRPGAGPAALGPSTQNVIENIIVSGGTAPLHVNLRNLNDTYPTNLTVRVNDPLSASCGIDATQPGGLNVMRNCIWSGCFLRWGCQNGVIDNPWGMGIEFAQGCVNTTEISAGYIYPNITHDANFWSQSYDSFQSVRALTVTATQMITDNPANSGAPSAYIDLNAFSAIRFIGCEFIGPTVNLLGTRGRKDSFADVMVVIEGGKHTGNLVLNDRSGFEYADAIGFLNDQTGQRVTKSRVATITPGISGVTTTTNMAKQFRNGNTVTVSGRTTWNATSGPLVITLPYGNLGSDAAVSIGYNGNSFSGSVPVATLGGGAQTISFFNAANGASLTPSSSGDLIWSVTYTAGA